VTFLKGTSALRAAFSTDKDPCPTAACVPITAFAARPFARTRTSPLLQICNLTSPPLQICNLTSPPLQICNLTKSESPYEHGLRPLAYRAARAAAGAFGWERVAGDLAYYPSAIYFRSRSRVPFRTLFFTFDADEDDDEVCLHAPHGAKTRGLAGRDAPRGALRGVAPPP
jgi:hypothetical protein